MDVITEMQLRLIDNPENPTETITGTSVWVRGLIIPCFQCCQSIFLYIEKFALKHNKPLKYLVRVSDLRSTAEDDLAMKKKEYDQMIIIKKTDDKVDKELIEKNSGKEIIRIKKSKSLNLPAKHQIDLQFLKKFKCASAHLLPPKGTFKEAQWILNFVCSVLKKKFLYFFQYVLT